MNHLSSALSTSKKQKKSLPKGLNEDIVRFISQDKKEPPWMLTLRLQAFKEFEQKTKPAWGVNLQELDFDDIYYYLPSHLKQQRTWEDVPRDVKDTFEKIGIPQAEREYLAGVTSQFDSEVIYGSLRKKLQKQGVLFMSMDEGLRKHPDIVKTYFSTLVPAKDNKFTALNTAVWSGGTFLYVPKGVKVEMPLQAYFWISSPLAGQFERTLIVVDEGAYVHYIEGCSAPIYSDQSLHSGVVEIFVGPNATCQYSTIQNWYTNVYNLVTKRARVSKNGKMFWVDGNFGSKATMKYPACYLEGEGAHGEMLSIAVAGKGQHQDTGAKMIHRAKGTTSTIVSKSISQQGGRASYRGVVHIDKKAYNCRSSVVCNGLVLDDQSRSDSYPVNSITNATALLEHEATVSKIREDQVSYLLSRGLTRTQANALIISGFIEPIVSYFPMEYAVELNRLIEMEIEGGL